jgi:hypothetical protein
VEADAGAAVDSSRSRSSQAPPERARGDGTVASYVNPNARCPVCHAPVIFYRSPYDGRVFFDPPLGPPWPKHPCTDSRRRDLKQSHSMRTKRRPIVIINRNHVLIRLPPSRRRIEFSEAARDHNGTDA